MDSNADPNLEQAIEAAALELRAGGVVAFPTETVYGLGADARNPRAVARVFEIKGRPRFDPLIVHVGSAAAARALAAEWQRTAEQLAERFWPGPLTLVVKKREAIPDIVTAGLGNVGLRVPDHPIALRLIERAEMPIAAPSANPFGRISPTTAQHVRDSFEAKVPIIVDGGPCRTGVESTVISLVAEPTLLRPGGVPVEDIEAVIGRVVRRESTSRPGGEALAAPGMLESHYAPRTPLRLANQLRAGSIPLGRVGYIGLRAPEAADRFAAIEVLSQDGDLREAATNLFSALRRLDALGLEAILAGDIPAHGLGLAIRDRLERAAAKG